MIHAFTPKRLRTGGLVAALVLALAALPLEGFAAPASSPSAAAVSGKIPRLANGKPDFSGIWESMSGADYNLEPHGNGRDMPPGPGVIAEGTIPYLPAALEKKRKNFEARDKLDPRLKGWTLGTPRGIYYPAPFQIFQRARDLTLVFQFGHSVRTIHTNGTPHPQEDDHEFWLGDSRARWDGDTLVVDVKDFTADTWLDRAGNHHSEKLHVVERWKFIDPNTIEYQARLEDPEVFAKPWTVNVLLHRHREKNFQLIEDYRFTNEYDQHYPPKNDSPSAPK